MIKSRFVALLQYRLLSFCNTNGDKCLQHYLDASEQDKERYNREFSDYKQTEAYRLFNEKQTERQNESKKERNGTDVNADQNVR